VGIASPDIDARSALACGSPAMLACVAVSALGPTTTVVGGASSTLGGPLVDGVAAAAVAFASPGGATIAGGLTWRLRVAPHLGQ
jgi:hypothetical protein